MRRLVLQVLKKMTKWIPFLLLGRSAAARMREHAGAMLPRTRTKTRTERKREGACPVLLLQPASHSLGPLLSEANVDPSEQGEMWFAQSQLQDQTQNMWF